MDTIKPYEAPKTDKFVPKSDKAFKPTDKSSISTSKTLPSKITPDKGILNKTYSK